MAHNNNSKQYFQVLRPIFVLNAEIEEFQRLFISALSLNVKQRKVDNKRF